MVLHARALQLADRVCEIGGHAGRVDLGPHDLDHDLGERRCGCLAFRFGLDLAFRFGLERFERDSELNRDRALLRIALGRNIDRAGALDARLERRAQQNARLTAIAAHGQGCRGTFGRCFVCLARSEDASWGWATGRTRSRVGASRSHRTHGLRQVRFVRAELVLFARPGVAR